MLIARTAKPLAFETTSGIGTETEILETTVIALIAHPTLQLTGGAPLLDLARPAVVHHPGMLPEDHEAITSSQATGRAPDPETEHVAVGESQEEEVTTIATRLVPEVGAGTESGTGDQQVEMS